MTRFGFVESTPGTCERGTSEHQRQQNMIDAFGGIVAYMRGAKPRDNKSLTDAAERGIIQEAEGHDKTPVTAA